MTPSCVGSNPATPVLPEGRDTDYGPLVKGLRHRLFTAVTRVRIPYGLWYVAVGTLDEKSFKKVSKKC